jgi:hypothetical protein
MGTSVFSSLPCPARSIHLNSTRVLPGAQHRQGRLPATQACQRYGRLEDHPNQVQIGSRNGKNWRFADLMRGSRKGPRLLSLLEQSYSM